MSPMLGGKRSARLLVGRHSHGLGWIGIYPVVTVFFSVRFSSLRSLRLALADTAKRSTQRSRGPRVWRDWDDICTSILALGGLLRFFTCAVRLRTVYSFNDEQVLPRLHRFINSATIVCLSLDLSSLLRHPRSKASLLPRNFLVYKPYDTPPC